MFTNFSLKQCNLKCLTVKVLNFNVRCGVYFLKDSRAQRDSFSLNGLFFILLTAPFIDKKAIPVHIGLSELVPSV